MSKAQEVIKLIEKDRFYKMDYVNFLRSFKDGDNYADKGATGEVIGGVPYKG